MTRMTVQNAMARNEFIIGLASGTYVAYAIEGGKTEKLMKERFK